MDLCLESDIYEPSVGDDGNYLDYLPPSSKFIHGLRCPCGSRKDHVFENKKSFSVHIKSITHQRWLAELNTTKMNYYLECEKLKEVVNSQKIIIAKMENDLQVKMKTINYLSQQLMARETGVNDMIDLLSFD
jgi:hypothetical protein